MIACQLAGCVQSSSPSQSDVSYVQQCGALIDSWPAFASLPSNGSVTSMLYSVSRCCEPMIERRLVCQLPRFYRVQKRWNWHTHKRHATNKDHEGKVKRVSSLHLLGEATSCGGARMAAEKTMLVMTISMPQALIARRIEHRDLFSTSLELCNCRSKIVRPYHPLSIARVKVGSY